MGKPWLRAVVRLLLSAVLLFAALGTATPSAQAAAADKTTKYRVYQNDKPLAEFAELNEAIAYATRWAHSRVEAIGTRQWLWDNFPRYRVYQFDVTLPQWEFTTLAEAIAEAKKWAYSSVRDLNGENGWVWDNWPRASYRVYQGDITLDSWEFPDLASAIREARKWAGSHIIDQTTYRWVWDNLSPSQKQALRRGEPVYRVYQYAYSHPSWQFAYLEDAINEALKWGDSHIVNTRTGKIVYRNPRPFAVYQFDNRLKSFAALGEALDYAKRWAYARVEYQGKPIWTNAPYFEVYQNEKRIGAFRTAREAAAFAARYADSSVRTRDWGTIWDNRRELIYWAWNGMSSDAAVRSQVAGTMGLDVVSPTWFRLGDASGSLLDASMKETADWLKQAGFQVHPLVSNQFNKDLTTAFLADAKAQDRFVSALVGRAAELDLHGLNLDFENVSGSDRAAFTTFVRKLADALHARGMKLSVDLPRGSARWNHLTAFDHAALKDIVDWIIIMAYDQHWSGGPAAGPVGAPAWVEEGIREFLSYGIPRHKLILGVPFYTREWTLDDSGNPTENRTIYIKDVPALLESTGAAPVWDPAFGQYRVEYVREGKKRVVWLETPDMVAARIDLAKKYDLAGVAAWRLGYEPRELWEMLLRRKK